MRAGVHDTQLGAGAAPACPRFARTTACPDQGGVVYERGPDMPGVERPVTLTRPIAGMTHRYLHADEPRATFFMDCELPAFHVDLTPDADFID
jgi:hypothetical protein